MMRRGFSSSPDRAAAIREGTERRARQTATARFDHGCMLAADELGRCLADGLTAWRDIIPRIRSRCGGAS